MKVAPAKFALALRATWVAELIGLFASETLSQFPNPTSALLRVTPVTRVGTIAALTGLSAAVAPEGVQVSVLLVRTV